MGEEIEDRVLPALLLTSITVDVVAMCSQGWILGYYGDILVMQFSPWRLCRLDCFYCTKEKPTFRCFGMRGWTDTDFDILDLVVHLQYWSLAMVGLSLITALFNCAEAVLSKHHLAVNCGKPALFLLTMACILSSVIVGIVGAKVSQDPGYISAFPGVQLSFGWPFMARVVSFGILLTSASLAVYRLWRHRSKPGLRGGGGSRSCKGWVCDGSSIAIAAAAAEEGAEGIEAETGPLSRDFYDDSVDEIENGSLL